MRSITTFNVNYAIRAYLNFPDAVLQFYKLIAFSNYDDPNYPVTMSSEHGGLNTWDATAYVQSAHLDVQTWIAAVWTLGSYKKFEVRRTSSKIVGVEEGGNSYQSTTNIPTGSLSICPAHETNNPPATKSFLIDWLLVRKYVDPEPSHGSWGSEESVESVVQLDGAVYMHGKRSWHVTGISGQDFVTEQTLSNNVVEYIRNRKANQLRGA